MFSTATENPTLPSSQASESYSSVTPNRLTGLFLLSVRSMLFPSSPPPPDCCRF